MKLALAFLAVCVLVLLEENCAFRIAGAQHDDVTLVPNVLESRVKRGSGGRGRRTRSHGGTGGKGGGKQPTGKEKQTNEELCPEGWTPSKDPDVQKCIFIHTEPLTHQEAEAFCRSKGGQLLVVTETQKGKEKTEIGPEKYRNQENNANEYMYNEEVQDDHNDNDDDEEEAAAEEEANEDDKNEEEEATEEEANKDDKNEEEEATDDDNNEVGNNEKGEIEDEDGPADNGVKDGTENGEGANEDQKEEEENDNENEGEGEEGNENNEENEFCEINLNFLRI